MSTQFSWLSILVTTAMSLAIASPGAAQNLAVHYNFPIATGQNPGGYPTNGAGANPQAGLTLASDRLYGTARSGGAAGWGTVFRIKPDGTGSAVLHEFPAIGIGPSGYFTNRDGIQPQCQLVAAGTRLYGTAREGGTAGFGTVFAVNTDGTGFTNLHNFTAGTGGANPQAGLVLSGTTLYGTTVGEASLGAAGTDYGTVFALQTDGSGFTNLHTFTVPHPIQGTNMDGAAPYASLVLSGDVLYGTACRGGLLGHGTVFAINTDGSGFTNLHYFSGSNGSSPQSGLIAFHDILYGVSGGGTGNSGTVFKLKTNGTSFAVLHHFDQWSFAQNGVTNRDGFGPNSLLLLGNMLYGTTSSGGTTGRGTVFTLNTDGSGFTNLHMFTELSEHVPTETSTNMDGAHPASGLLVSETSLYGVASAGGTHGSGTIFSIAFPPQLTVLRAGASVVLSWPTQHVGFDYSNFTPQSATSLVSPIWTADMSVRSIVNGNYTITNSLPVDTRFYRLTH